MNSVASPFSNSSALGKIGTGSSDPTPAEMTKACKDDFDNSGVTEMRNKMIKIASRFPLPPPIEY